MLGTSTWTSAASNHDNLPITNVQWFDAFAFCAWDGGRLPTLAEWSFAASGGNEQRAYPWGGTDGNVPANHAAWDCAVTAPPYTCPPATCSVPGYSCPPAGTDCVDVAAGACNVAAPCFGCGPEDIAKVGTFPAGVGKFGQLDLAGNVAELVLDATNTLKTPPPTCNDCAPLMGAGTGGIGRELFNVFILNGNWSSKTAAEIQNDAWQLRRWRDRLDTVGFRCARD
jgi:formylglycine-generating enzyme required for sulfatase activity